jgi:hypothetical protein
VHLLVHVSGKDSVIANQPGKPVEKNVRAQSEAKKQVGDLIFLDHKNDQSLPRATPHARTLRHSPTFVTLTLPSGCPRTETLSNRTAAYKPERNRLRLLSSVPTPGTSKC